MEHKTTRLFFECYCDDATVNELLSQNLQEKFAEVKALAISTLSGWTFFHYIVKTQCERMRLHIDFFVGLRKKFLPKISSCRNMDELEKVLQKFMWRLGKFVEKQIRADVKDSGWYKKLPTVAELCTKHCATEYHDALSEGDATVRLKRLKLVAVKVATTEQAAVIVALNTENLQPMRKKVKKFFKQRLRRIKKAKSETELTIMLFECITDCAAVLEIAKKYAKKNVDETDVVVQRFSPSFKYSWVVSLIIVVTAVVAIAVWRATAG